MIVLTTRRIDIFFAVDLLLLLSVTALSQKEDGKPDFNGTGKGKHGENGIGSHFVNGSMEEIDEDIKTSGVRFGGQAHEDLRVFQVIGRMGKTLRARERKRKTRRQNVHITDKEERIQEREAECEFYYYQRQLAHAKGIDPDTVPHPENNKECQIEKPNKRRRQKRLAVTGVKGWTNAIVPYEWTESTTSDADQMGRIRAHNHYHYWTCVRFVPHTSTTRSDYKLDHNNFLYHTKGSGCYSSSGNRKENGQKINCCMNDICVHEMGHVLGMAHEQKNPLRGDYSRANIDAVHESKQWNYIMRNIEVSKTFGYYDLSSVMHYGFYAFSMNNYPSITVLDPDMKYLVSKTDPYQFYHFYESSFLSNCTALKCADFTMKCQHNGYQAYIKDRCTCRCPEGLDPAFGCKTKYEGDRLEASKWPSEGFTLLRTAYGCPHGFRSGTATQHHLKTALSRSTKEIDADMVLEDLFTVYNFCTKLKVEETGVSQQWPKGRYCIYRHGGSCPKGFSEGSIQYDDDGMPTGISGILPDGDFTSDTLFNFCCRSDGPHYVEIKLPNDSPFILFRNSRKCQAVEGMQSKKQWFRIKNMKGTLKKATGEYPRLTISYKLNYQLHYCYYTPRDFDNSLIHSDWPVDRFTMIKPKSHECPKGFHQGFQRQFVLLGEQSNTVYADINIDDTEDVIEYNFCTKEPTAASGIATKWGPGQYCIYRKDSCPPEFREGYITFADQQKPIVEGEVPDGDYVNTATEWVFCCRQDGFARNPLVLPNKEPFVLFQQQKNKCQHVLDMDFNEEWIMIKSDAVNQNGHTPYIRKYFKKYYLFYCYYYPADYSCGGILNLGDDLLSADIQSPGYPNPYPARKTCVWNVLAPKNSKIKFEIHDFNLVANTDGTCDDYLEVRFTLPGQFGISYCGDSFPNTVISETNQLGLTFKSDLSRSSKGFNSTVTLLKPEDFCYIGKGEFYRGSVSNTNHFKECLPWSKVKHCRHHAYEATDLDDGLFHNFCRNPGHGTTPWCYTEETQCERDFCDVCGFEKCYDVFDDCIQLMADPTFCSNDIEASRGCRKSCGFCTSPPPAAPWTNCGRPEVPIDSTPSDDLQDTYSPGETVEFKCNGNKYEKQVHTCQLGGTWSGSPFVCGRCPAGWVPFRKRCYKWFDGTYTRAEAKNECFKHNGITASAMDEEQNELVNSIVENGRNVWIGLEEGVWVDVGVQVTWTNYKSGATKKCAYSESNTGKWVGIGCNVELFLSVVCTYTPTDRTLCVDAITDCQKYLESDARTCLDNDDFAWHTCPQTCGFCGSPDTCNAPPTPQNAIAMTSDSFARVGDVFEFRCKDGYSLSSGDLTRACLPDISLSGSPANCLLSTNVAERNNDVGIVLRRATIPTSFAYTGNNDAMKIHKTGKIVSWSFYSKFSGTVILQVWRIANINNRFTFIGQNIISPTLDDRKRVVEIDIGEQISVKDGDLIGVYVPNSDKSGIPVTYCDMTQSGDTYGGMMSFYTTSVDWTVKETYDFYPDEDLCMIISVTAFIE